MKKIFSRQIILSIVALAAISVLEISLSSPLFAVLGFEYSTLMGLALSLICGIAESIRPNSTENKFGFTQSISSSLLLASVPLVLSDLSLPVIHNCSFIDGFVFYLEIAYPCAILGSLFGLASRQLIKNRNIALLSFIAFWLITLFLSLLPGYFNPQLFTYGWQYGFFPGFIWDESLELSNAYLAFRLENIIWVIFALSLSYEMRLRRLPKMWFAIPGVIMIVLFGFNDFFQITSSHSAVMAQLKQNVQPVPNCKIYYAPNSLTPDEIDKIERDVKWYLHDIKHRFALHDEPSPIRIYIYPSNESMFSLIGTRVASIAKPWLGEVHITKNNLQSLKHELTHVLLRQKGAFPFYASWSTGLTEGAAMSVESEYDGIYTLDEHAARILQMKYATGVKQVMSFTGFAANASSKSYVLAGSFSRYLLSQYGSDRFDKLYSSLDYEKEYGKPIDSLESEWKRWLAQFMSPMDSGDSAHFRYYYDRSSIVFSPCLRRIGKLERKASIAYSEKRFNDAEHLYHSCVEEGGGISALLGEAYSLERKGDFSSALRVLDTANSPIVQKQSSALDIDKADLCLIANDDVDSKDISHALFVKLSSRWFLRAYAREQLCYHPDLWRKFLRTSLLDPGDTSALKALMQLDTEVFFDPESHLALHTIEFNRFLSKGDLKSAVSLDLWTKHPYYEVWAKNTEMSVVGGIPFGSVLNLVHIFPPDEADSLALSIFALEMAKLRPGPTCVECCPNKYRRAAKEQADEITAEWDFLNAQPH